MFSDREYFFHFELRKAVYFARDYGGVSLFDTILAVQLLFHFLSDVALQEYLG